MLKVLKSWGFQQVSAEVAFAVKSSPDFELDRTVPQDANQEPNYSNQFDPYVKIATVMTLEKQTGFKNKYPRKRNT